MKWGLRTDIRALRVAAGLVAAGWLACAPIGCSKGSSGGWFEKKHTSQEWLDMALESQSADDRRQAVIGLAKSRDGGADWAMKVYDTIARTDSNMMVRCAAVHAMGPNSCSEQVPTLLKLLNSRTHHYEDVRPADGPLRWESAKVLLVIIDDYRYRDDQRPQIVQALLERVARDDDRNVRLTAIDSLAYFAEEPIPSALVTAMEEDDFAVQSAAEQALISLTGMTFHHDPKAWRYWLSQTRDPFEKAGQIPEGSQIVGRHRQWSWDWDF